MRDDNARLTAGTLPPEAFEDCERLEAHGDVDAPQWVTNVRNLEGVEPRTVQWLWEPRVPLGMVAVFAGAKATGKGHIAVEMCSAVSRGGNLPGESVDSQVRIPQGHVLYLNAEDPVEEAIIPRLQAAGADMRFVHHVSTVRREDQEFPTVLTLAENWQLVKDLVEQIKPRLFLIDTLFSHAGADTISNAEMAPVMSMLSLLAERHNMAVVVIHHTTKAPHARASGDVSGGTVIATTARSVLMVGANHDKSERALFHVDSNVGREAPPIGYAVSPMFNWHDTDLTIDECRYHNRGAKGANGTSKREQAEDALDELVTEPRKLGELADEMKARGLEHQFYMAMTAKGIEAKRIGLTWWRYKKGDPLHEQRIKQLVAEHEERKAGEVS